MLLTRDLVREGVNRFHIPSAQVRPWCGQVDEPARDTWLSGLASSRPMCAMLPASGRPERLLARAHSKRNAGSGGGNKAGKFKQMAPADEGVLSDADR